MKKYTLAILAALSLAAVGLNLKFKGPGPVVGKGLNVGWAGDHWNAK